MRVANVAINTAPPYLFYREKGGWLGWVEA